MVFPGYLAMTGAEIAQNPALPRKIAWMACHFSPYGAGLSNCPESLPPGSMVIVNDRTPIGGHDPDRIVGQLGQVIEKLNCGRILLDFQRPGSPETAEVVQALVRKLPCPVGVSEPYAEGLPCPVFLPPVPLTCPLSDYLAPWQGREIWLEAALNGEVVTVTEEGASFAPITQIYPADGFENEALRCHYRITAEADSVRFNLWRTEEDLAVLVQDTHIRLAVGLYQELG